MNNKTLLLTLSFTLGTLFTNAQSLPGFQWGEGMGQTIQTQRPQAAFHNHSYLPYTR